LALDCLEDKEAVLPVFRSEVTNDWCQLEHFDVINIAIGGNHVFDRLFSKEKLIVIEGRCIVDTGYRKNNASAGDKFTLDTPDGNFHVDEVLSDTVLVRVCGSWGEEIGGFGIFEVGDGDRRQDRGDLVDYPKETGFDNHYHDFDEYWIIVKGRGKAVTEGISYDILPGDCVATGMGHHHDLPQVSEFIQAVYFETTLEGQKRLGHLYNHTDGPAHPKLERV